MEVIRFVHRQPIGELELTRRYDDGCTVGRIDLCVTQNAVVIDLQSRNRIEHWLACCIEQRPRLAPDRMNDRLVVDDTAAMRLPDRLTGQRRRRRRREVCIQVIDIEVVGSDDRIGCPDVAVDDVHGRLDR